VRLAGAGAAANVVSIVAVIGLATAAALLQQQHHITVLALPAAQHKHLQHLNPYHMAQSCFRSAVLLSHGADVAAAGVMHPAAACKSWQLPASNSGSKRSFSSHIKSCLVVALGLWTSGLPAFGSQHV
jgi:hypothetical protein